LENKTDKASNSVQIKIREGSPDGIGLRVWRKGFVKDMSFTSRVKGRGLIDDEIEGDDCDEVICAG